jgi:hypothetical protein
MDSCSGPAMIMKFVGFLVGPALVILGMVLSFVVFKMSRHMLGANSAIEFAHRISIQNVRSEI